jgi:hypothetical protein
MYSEQLLALEKMITNARYWVNGHHHLLRDGVNTRNLNKFLYDVVPLFRAWKRVEQQRNDRRKVTYFQLYKKRLAALQVKLVQYSKYGANSHLSRLSTINFLKDFAPALSYEKLDIAISEDYKNVKRVLDKLTAEEIKTLESFYKFKVQR